MLGGRGREGERERWITGIKASPHTIKITLQLEINYPGIECEISGNCGEYQSIRGGEKGSLGKIEISAVAVCLLKQSFLFPSLNEKINCV